MIVDVLEQIEAIADALKAGASNLSPDLPIPVGDSSSVEYALYDVVSQELGIQFRNRRAKIYWYPMGYRKAAEFATASSKGRWLKGRAHTVAIRDPYSGRFDGGKAVDLVRRRQRRGRANRL